MTGTGSTEGFLVDVFTSLRLLFKIVSLSSTNISKGLFFGKGWCGDLGG